MVSIRVIPREDGNVRDEGDGTPGRLLQNCAIV